jgi:hypothetical protein
MYGSMVIGFRWDTIGTGIEAIGLGHRMPVLVGTLLVMNKGCISKATGKETMAATRTTTTGTVIEAGIIGRKSAIARKTRKIGEQSKKDNVVRPVIGRQQKM